MRDCAMVPIGCKPRVRRTRPVFAGLNMLGSTDPRFDAVRRGAGSEGLVERFGENAGQFYGFTQQTQYIHIVIKHMERCRPVVIDDLVTAENDIFTQDHQDFFEPETGFVVI